MAPIERWYKKWDLLKEDSADSEQEQKQRTELEQVTHLPQDIVATLNQERNPERREALLALNSFVAELHNPPRATPARQQHLLRFLSQSLRGLQEGGELERLVWQVHAVLHHPEVSHRKLEECAGACALLEETDPVDPRLTSAILSSSRDRIHEFSAASLARTCWSAASLAKFANNSEAALLLEKGLRCAEGKLADFVPEDVSLLAWACAAQPDRAGDFFEKLQAAAGAIPSEPGNVPLADCDGALEGLSAGDARDASVGCEMHLEPEDLTRSPRPIAFPRDTQFVPLRPNLAYRNVRVAETLRKRTGILRLCQSMPGRP
eukprot:s1483_g7.t1